MNFQCDAVIAIQCETEAREGFHWNDHTILRIDRNERGAGRYRNCSIYEGNHEFLQYTDDDIWYHD